MEIGVFDILYSDYSKAAVTEWVVCTPYPADAHDAAWDRTMTAINVQRVTLYPAVILEEFGIQPGALDRD